MSNTIIVAKSWRDLLSKAARMLQQPLFTNAGYLLGVQLVVGLGGFAYWGLAARLYEAEEVGTASALISAVMLLVGLSDMGVGLGLVRFLPEAQFPGRLLNTAFTFVAGVALIAACGYVLGVESWSPSLAVLRGSALYIVGFAVLTVAVALVNLVNRAFVARRRAAFALIQACVFNGGRLLLVGLVVSRSLEGLIGSAILAVVLSLVLSVAFLLPIAQPGYRPRPDWLWPSLATIIPFSAGSYFADLLGQVPQMLLPMMILESLGEAPSGYSYIAWSLSILLTGPGSALAASAFAEGSSLQRGVDRVFVRAAAMSTSVTVPTAMVVGVFAPWLLTVLSGSDYAREASDLLRWLAGATPLVVLNRLWFARLRVRKRVGQLTLLNSLCALVTIGVTAIWMPRFGISVSGIGWLLGNGLALVAAVASISKEKAKRTWQRSR